MLIAIPDAGSAVREPGTGGKLIVIVKLVCAGMVDEVLKTEIPIERAVELAVKLSKKSQILKEKLG